MPYIARVNWLTIHGISSLSASALTTTKVNFRFEYKLIRTFTLKAIGGIMTRVDIYFTCKL